MPFENKDGDNQEQDMIKRGDSVAVPGWNTEFRIVDIDDTTVIAESEKNGSTLELSLIGENELEYRSGPPGNSIRRFKV